MAKPPVRKPKKKVCLFCQEKIAHVDYKDTGLLRKFISDRGKIRARRVSGNCTQHQRDVATAIKNGSHVELKVFSNTGAPLASFPPPSLASGISKFGIGKTDINQDGKQELVLGRNPAGIAQFLIIDPLTGSVTDTFNGFSTLVGGFSIDGA